MLSMRNVIFSMILHWLSRFLAKHLELQPKWCEKKIKKLSEHLVVTKGNVALKFKAPTYNRTTPFQFFKFQFKTAVKSPQWRQLCCWIGSDAKRRSSRRFEDDFERASCHGRPQWKYRSEHRKQFFRMDLQSMYRNLWQKLKSWHILHVVRSLPEVAFV